MLIARDHSKSRVRAPATAPEFVAEPVPAK
jgi:hypothetical protein